MGVGGRFWDLLKPYSRLEGPDFLRDKRVAIDLSFWIVQQETALRATRARKPHLRLTFYRTINLFSKFAAYPVFVVDGNPSPLKSQARISRFLNYTGIDVSDLHVPEENSSPERNQKFTRMVQECLELLDLLGMPVITAKGEAEALCAQLEYEGRVDACITADSDAFLFGASCVIKAIRPNSREPFECYNMHDIELGLCLKREHLIAISMLVGNDHDREGVPSIGIETALRFVRAFREDEILHKLRGIEKVDADSVSDSFTSSSGDHPTELGKEPILPKLSRCFFCGHPGAKRTHSKSSCQYCCGKDGEGCVQEAVGFRCLCSPCDTVKKDDQQKDESWWLRFCNKIATRPDFPNQDIINMYLCKDNGYFREGEGPCLSWRSPQTEMLVDFLSFQLFWKPSSVRRLLFPLLSTHFLREAALNPGQHRLLQDLYKFDSILRVKIKYGHEYYVVKWRKNVPTLATHLLTPATKEHEGLDDTEVDDSFDSVDDSDDGPNVHIDDGSCFLLTDENVNLVRAAFPEEVDRFSSKQKELMGSRRRAVLMEESPSRKQQSEKPSNVQPNVTEAFCSSKENRSLKLEDSHSPNEKRKESSSCANKSVRRRLFFD